MFPVLTRAFWLVAQPVSVIAVLLLLGLVLSFTRRRGWARIFLALGFLLLFVTGFTTFGYLLITPLEQRFVRPAEPARIDGIVVLGGGMDGEVNDARQGWELNQSGDRMVEAVRLAQAHPEAKVLVAAGPAVFPVVQEPEAYAAKRMLVAFGIAPERIVLDDKSRNTEENAQFAEALAGDVPGQVWLLVTSAYHMPRAVGLFRKAGFAVVPWPADYLASGVEGVRLKPDQSPENIVVSTTALREWAGLIGYKLVGKIDELLPAP